MLRPPVDVRRADRQDVEDLLLLWTQAREEDARSVRALSGVAVAQVRPRLLEALAGEEVQVLLARTDDVPVGYALLRVAPVAGLMEGRVLHVEHLYVAPSSRRHGVGHALLVAVASLAERHGCDQVVSNVAPGARETHRFLARLGFTPLVVRRVASTAALRRKLCSETSRGALDQLLSRRRSLRARVSLPRWEDIAPEAGQGLDDEVPEGASAPDSAPPREEVHVLDLDRSEAARGHRVPEGTAGHA